MDIHVAGYGSITVERSDLETDDEFSDFVGDVVAKVMNLVAVDTQRERFHPVLGIGGYETHNTRRSARRDSHRSTE